ncbi:MAG TPA: hypothetical protein VGU02_07435 [Gaiellaceae bacterium]|nr:hypothetical protein [Gaiellaceae bacterium]
MIVIAVCALAVTCGFAGIARADSGGDGSPMAICQDLQDGTVDGSYTEAQWNAFLSDPTVQGYCSVIVPPCVTGTGSNGGGSMCQPTTTTTTTTTPAPPVPLTPAPAAAVAPAAVVKTKPAAVKGATHTTRARPAPATLGTSRTQGTLPFTGLQLTVVLAFALALVGAGLVLRRTGRVRDER